MSRRVPNFFLVGAPKCGTTAMATYLEQHPDVFMGPKEIHYFASSVVGHPLADTWDDYLELFQEATQRHRIIGDASVYYLYAAAGARIQKVAPDAKILVMVRNPAQMVVSLHQQLYVSHNEDEPDFEVAWRLQERRARGDGIPRDCFNPATLQYARVGRFGSQLEVLFESFTREQVEVVIHDDLIADPRAVYEKVLDFLGLESDGRTSFPRINERKRERSRWLGRLVKRSPFGVWRRIKRAAGIEARGLKRLVLRLNSSTVSPPPIGDRLRRELVETFEPEVEKIETLLGRNLAAWKR
jgi:hypothetical protein